MELTQEEKELILKKREKESESKSNSKKFNEIYKKVKSIAESRVESVKQMTANEATYYENGNCPLVEIYSTDEPYLSAYRYKMAGYKFTKDQFDKLDNLCRYYENVAHSLFKELLADEYSSELSKLSDNAKHAIFNKSWEDGHSSGCREVYYHYGENVDFIMKCLG